MTSMTDAFTLPCGATLPNRIAKAAMTEGLADPWLRATERHARAYRQWSHGGAGRYPFSSTTFAGNAYAVDWLID